MILSSADFVNDRRIVLSGVDTFQIFLFVWNILLEFEKKHSCNSIPRKSSDYLISYLDIYFCRNLIPRISRLSYQLKLLQLCVMKSFRWNAARHCDFISRSLIFSFVHFYIHFFYHTCIHWSFMLNCSELQRFPVCTCFGSLNLFIFISSRHLYSHVIFDTSDSNNFYFLSFPKGTTSFSTECNDGCVVKCGIHSL